VTAANSERTTTDQQGLLPLYRRSAGIVYRLALSMTRDVTAAEDVVQEAFCRVQQQLGRLGEDRALDGYLYQTVRNLALDVLRQTKRPVDPDAEIELVAAPEGARVDPELTRRIARALWVLPVEQREVVMLRIYEGCTFPRVAELTESPLGTVHSRFRYAMQRLRRELEETDA